MTDSDDRSGQPLTHDEALIAFLRDRDLPCPGCGYNLRNLYASRCPECRQVLRLLISTAEPPPVAYALAVIGLAAGGIGFAIVLLGVLILSVFQWGFPTGFAAVMWIWLPMIIILLSAVAVAGLLGPAGRAWFRARASSGSWKVVLLCWTCSFLIGLAWLMAVLIPF